MISDNVLHNLHHYFNNRKKKNIELNYYASERVIFIHGTG